ncbi:MAG: hypothetical protein J0L84_06435 [Verrucomicrobia bacterium]|nr:hypothetical protein [Verrucomicrobiota bacterium]
MSTLLSPRLLTLRIPTIGGSMAAALESDRISLLSQIHALRILHFPIHTVAILFFSLAGVWTQASTEEGHRKPPLGELPQLPVLQSGAVASVPAGAGGDVHFIYFGFSIDFNDPTEEYYTVFFELIPTNAAAPLRASGSRIDFQEEEMIGPGSQVYRDSGGGNRHTLTAFDQAGLGEDAPWRYMDVYANAPTNTLYYKARSMTEVFVGYRFPEEDGLHYGWLKFARSDTGFTNIFDLVAHDWHPIPGVSIGAGMPPEVPLETQVVDDSAGNALLRVGWHPGVASWSFETTDSLVPPVIWTEFPAEGTSAEVPLGNTDSQRYFRLRRP